MNVDRVRAVAPMPRRPTEPIAILPSVWRVGGGSWSGTVQPLSAEADGNVYFLELEGADVLVDCGTRAGSRTIGGNLRSIGRAPETVTDVLLSHSHWDHTDGVPAWQARDRSPTIHLNRIGAMFLARGDHRLVGHQLQELPHRFEPFRVDHRVHDGERFALGRTTVEVHFLPGHTPDSTLYTFELGGRTIGVCGDIAFGPTARHRVVLGQLCTLWLSNLDHYVESLCRLAALPVDVLLPGHGDVVIGRENVGAAVRRTLELAESLAADARVRENLGV
jgi:glyoxylase-like metal-dependent hydrolase (beta-lactamase superfamily II)